MTKNYYLNLGQIRPYLIPTGLKFLFTRDDLRMSRTTDQRLFSL
ncbi:hypothetical protein CLV32_0908 [Pedobacter duraquae]|uniref:Uncharacterized protein n=1 Tax=Pedobacter duraquae TaxID=425511 RepID=A0A4R6IQK8_9SPHI|nr:hypothetical protein CLV32_0908 [Pedobacter duraquae]